MKKPKKSSEITFIDLFAGIGGTRLGFQQACDELGVPRRCVFTSEWDKYSKLTYKANFGEEPHGDIIATKSKDIPEHDVLIAGFPCQPFSIAGVSKKNALNMPHGFDCQKQGNLFFEIERIVRDRQPSAFILENVKNLRSHDGGRTYAVIENSLKKVLGYHVDDRIYDAQSVVPQHRERIFIVGFRDAEAFARFRFPDIKDEKPVLGSILEKKKVDPKYTLTDHLWQYLQDYKAKHASKGNGFGFSLFGRKDVARTLSARYYKDGSEILIKNGKKNPRRLTPRECASLMGFPEDYDISAVSDTQLYRQFGNSVVVPVVKEISKSIIKALQTEGNNMATSKKVTKKDSV